MGYYSSQFLRTLNHWQTGGKGKGTIDLPRNVLLYGLIIDGVNYYFPIVMWDHMSELTDAQVHPNLTRKGFAFQFDPANLTPIASAIQKDADKKNTFYRAIYQLDKEGQCKWATQTIRTDSESLTINNVPIKSGQDVGIALPVFNIYLLVEGRCTSDKIANMPSWMNAYKKSDKVYDDTIESTRDYAAALKPGLFQGLGKVPKGTVIITNGVIKGDYIHNLGSSQMFGVHKFYDEQPNYYSGGGYYGNTSLFSVSSPEYHSGYSAGSTVDTRRWYKDVAFSGHDIGGYEASGVERHTVDGGYYDYYITREPVKYSLTHGIIWKRQE